MKIRWIDAIDAFSHGGYIDLETMHYIAPKWFSDLCPENDTGLSESDYEEIAKAPERYLRVPIFRMCGIRCIAAIEMGMTRDELIRLGMKKKEYWDVFFPCQNFAYYLLQYYSPTLPSSVTSFASARMAYRIVIGNTVILAILVGVMVKRNSCFAQYRIYAYESSPHPFY